MKKKLEEQNNNCFGKIKCAIILSNKLDIKQHKVVSTFLGISNRDLRYLRFIPDMNAINRIRNIYLKGREIQLKELAKTANLDRDSQKRIMYLIKFNSRNFIKNILSE